MTHPRHTADSARREEADAVFVVGGGVVGHEVAARLSAEDGAVTCVTTTPPADGHTDRHVHLAASIDCETLAAADLGEADAVVVLGADDAQNLLVAQLARTRFDADRVVARVNDPRREPAFERLGVEVVDTTQALAHTAVERW